MYEPSVSFLEKIYGSPGKFTFYNLNSQTIVRRKAKTISNPKTEKQQANRENIPFLLSAFRNLRPLLIISLNNRSHIRSAYNEFFSRNLNYSIVNGQFFPEKFKVSIEDIPGTDFQVERIINASNKFQLSWTNVLAENQNDNDILCAVIYSPSGNCFNYSITENIRLMKAAQMTFNRDFYLVSCYLYLFFVRFDYSLSSEISVHYFDEIN